VRYLSIILTLISAGSAARAAAYLVYAGTYTRNNSKGIYAFRFSSSSGKLKSLGVAAEIANPSFLAFHPNRRFLYAVNEGNPNGVSAFALDPKTGKLTFLNQVSSQGSGPCHLAVDGTGRWLVVANYNNGTMAVIPVHPDGSLGEATQVERHQAAAGRPQRQGSPHAHCVVFSADNRFLLLADLGLDRIFVYQFDAGSGKLTPNEPAFAAMKQGSGVRHLAFHPNGRVLYAVDEIGLSVAAFHFDPAKGTLENFQYISTVPEGTKGDCAEVAVNRAGTRLYASTRGADLISLFAIEPNRQTLTAMDRTPVLGKTPRHFTLDPSGKFLLAANQDSNDITIFRIHPRTGQLTPVGMPIKDAPAPVCVLFLPPK
jgi:6-phosphogluconolactonase